LDTEIACKRRYGRGRPAGIGVEGRRHKSWVEVRAIRYTVTVKILG
jgi:hypothetical protein